MIEGTSFYSNSVEHNSKMQFAPDSFADHLHTSSSAMASSAKKVCWSGPHPNRRFSEKFPISTPVILRSLLVSLDISSPRIGSSL
eukprot:3853102-Rhodomonas_salina.1